MSEGEISDSSTSNAEGDVSLITDSELEKIIDSKAVDNLNSGNCREILENPRIFWKETNL